MDFDDYQRLAARTMRAGQSDEERLANFALGIAGEAGETADLLKKVLFHGHTLDRSTLGKELGDVLWYIAALASTCDLSLAEIAAGNIAKLQRRYPDGFSATGSQQRRDTEDL